MMSERLSVREPLSVEELRSCLVDARDTWDRVIASDCDFEYGVARIMAAVEMASEWDEDPLIPSPHGEAGDVFINLLEIVNNVLERPESGDDARLWLLAQVNRPDISVPYSLALNNTLVQMLSRGTCSDAIFTHVALGDNDNLHRALLVSPYVPESIRVVLTLRGIPPRRRVRL